MFVMAFSPICVTEKKKKDRILTLLHSEQPKLHRVLAVLNAIGLRCIDTLAGTAVLCCSMELWLF